MCKSELEALVSRYGMSVLLNNEIEQMRVGYYVDSEALIPELDALCEESDKREPGPGSVYFCRDLLGLEYRYRVFVPATWL